MSNDQEFNWNGPGAEELYEEAKGAHVREVAEYNRRRRSVDPEYRKRDNQRIAGYIRARSIRNKISGNIIINGRCSIIGFCEGCGEVFHKARYEGGKRFCEECAIDREEIGRGGIFSGWAVAVKSRDKVCQVCGSSHQLEAHHIVPKLQDPSLARDVDNGIVLCAKCHREGEGALHRVLGNIYSPEAFAVWFESRKGSLSDSLDQWL